MAPFGRQLDLDDPPKAYSLIGSRDESCQKSWKKYSLMQGAGKTAEITKQGAFFL